MTPFLSASSGASAAALSGETRGFVGPVAPAGWRFLSPGAIGSYRQGYARSDGISALAEANLTSHSANECITAFLEPAGASLQLQPIGAFEPLYDAVTPAAGRVIDSIAAFTLLFDEAAAAAVSPLTAPPDVTGALLLVNERDTTTDERVVVAHRFAYDADNMQMTVSVSASLSVAGPLASQGSMVVPYQALLATATDGRLVVRPVDSSMDLAGAPAGTHPAAAGLIAIDATTAALEFVPAHLSLNVLAARAVAAPRDRKFGLFKAEHDGQLRVRSLDITGGLARVIVRGFGVPTSSIESDRTTWAAGSPDPRYPDVLLLQTVLGTYRVRLAADLVTGTTMEAEVAQIAAPHPLLDSIPGTMTPRPLAMNAGYYSDFVQLAHSTDGTLTPDVELSTDLATLASAFERVIVKE